MKKIKFYMTKAMLAVACFPVDFIALIAWSCCG